MILNKEEWEILNKKGYMGPKSIRGKDSSSRTPLMFALRDLARGGRSQWNSLSIEEKKPNLGIIKKILKSRSLQINAQDWEGESALWYMGDFKKTFHLLKAAQINVNHLNKEGNSYLYYCVIEAVNNPGYSHIKRIKPLILSGAQPDLVNNAGETVWDIARENQAVLDELQNAVFLNEKRKLNVSIKKVLPQTQSKDLSVTPIRKIRL